MTIAFHPAARSYQSPSHNQSRLHQLSFNSTCCVLFVLERLFQKCESLNQSFERFFVANISLDSLVFTSFPLQLNSRVLCHISFLYSLLDSRSFIKLLIFSRKINDFFHLFPPEADFQESRVGKSQKSLINVAAVYFPKSYPPAHTETCACRRNVHRLK